MDANTLSRWGLRLPAAVLAAWVGVAEAQQGALFTHGTEEAVHLRWNAPLEAGYRGFHVERRPAGGDWQRLTAEPVTRVSDVAEIRELLGYNADAFLTFFDPGARMITDDAFNRAASDEIARSLIQLISVKEPAVGYVLGERFDDEDLQPGRAFEYRVIRIDPAGGESVWAQTAQPVTHGTVDTVPVPRELAGEGVDSTALLGWLHDAQLSRSGRVVGYHVYRALKPFGPFRKITAEALVPAAIDGALPEYFLTDRYLTNGTSYWYQVTGMNVLGFESAPSETVEIVPRDMTPPLPPEQLTGSLLNGHALLEWSAVDAPDLAGYRVYRAASTEGPFELLAPDSEGTPLTMTSYLDQQIAEGDVLWYEVRAVDTSNNESLPSPLAEVFRPDITPPAPVANLEAESGEDGIYLRWGANTEPDLAGYLVKRTTRIDGAGAEAEVNGQFFTQNVEPLTVTEFTDPVPERSESRYAYQVIAVDQAQNQSAPSETVIARMPDIVPPSRPAVTSVVMEGQDVAIYWSRSLEPDLAGYHVYRSAEGEYAFDRLTSDMLEPDTTRFLDRPPETGAVFEYQVTALDQTGNESEPSFALPIRYLDVTGPPPPTGLAVQVAEAGLQLSWRPDSASDAVYLLVYRTEPDTETDRTLRELAPDASGYLDTLVAEDQSYTYYLRAFDAAGNAGEPSERVSATFSRKASQ